MTMEHAIAFMVGMILWTSLPGPGLVAVVSRALGSGVQARFAVIAGLVVADIIFLAIAFAGLTAAAAAMGPLFAVVKYAGAAYLVWQGYRLIVAGNRPVTVEARTGGTWWRDMVLGLLITLGNPKAILFFGALLPMFFDMTRIDVVDFLILTGIVAGVSCLVYGGYMFLAERARRLVASTRTVRRIRQAAGTALIGVGLVVATR